jgi:hypothetical protein
MGLGWGGTALPVPGCSVSTVAPCLVVESRSSTWQRYFAPLLGCWSSKEAVRGTFVQLCCASNGSSGPICGTKAFCRDMEV